MAEAARVRPATASDLPALVAIEKAAFASDRLSPRSLRRLMARPTAVMFVLEADAGVVGYGLVLFRRGGRAARLYSLAVAPGQAGRGHGRRLLAAAEAAAVRRGCENLTLEVRADNAAAIALYTASGYRDAGRLPDYYQDMMSAVRLTKPLAGTPRL